MNNLDELAQWHRSVAKSIMARMMSSLANAHDIDRLANKALDAADALLDAYVKRSEEWRKDAEETAGEGEEPGPTYVNPDIEPDRDFTKEQLQEQVAELTKTEKSKRTMWDGMEGWAGAGSHLPPMLPGETADQYRARMNRPVGVAENDVCYAPTPPTGVAEATAQAIQLSQVQVYADRTRDPKRELVNPNWENCNDPAAVGPFFLPGSLPAPPPSPSGESPKPDETPQK